MGEAAHLRALSWAVGMAITRLLVPYCISFTALAVFSSTRMCAFRGSGTPKPTHESTAQANQLWRGCRDSRGRAALQQAWRARSSVRVPTWEIELIQQDGSPQRLSVCLFRTPAAGRRPVSEGWPLREGLRLRSIFSTTGLQCVLHLEVSATTMMAAADEAATLRRSAGTRGEPDLKTKTLPNLRSSGMMRRKVFSISTLDRLLRTTTVLPPSLL